MFTVDGTNWDNANVTAGTYASGSTYMDSSSFYVYIKVTNSNWIKDSAKFGFRCFDNNVYVGTKVSGSYGTSGVIVRCSVPSSVLSYGFQLTRMNSSCSEGTTTTSNIWNYSNNVESDGTGTQGRFGYDSDNIYVKTAGMYVIYATTNYVQLSIEKAYALTLDTQGGTINSGYDENYYQYGTTTTLSNDVTKADYSFKGWFTASTGGTQVTSISSSATGAKTYYAQWNAIYDIEFMASYIIIDKDGTYTHSTIPSDSIGSTTGIANNTYNAPNSGYTDLKYKSDNTNGIYYKFARDGSKWYTDERCRAQDEYSASTLTGPLTLYAKYVADVRVTSSTHKTFYVDIRNSKEHTNGGKWSGVIYRDASHSYKETTAFKVAPNLYRLTVPSDCNYQLRNSGGSEYAHDYTTTPIASSTLTSITSGSTIMFIYDSDNGQNHTYRMPCSTITSSTTGEAKVQYYSGGWQDLVTMEVGDQNDSNYFIYEHGVEVPLGTEVRISVSGGPAEGNYYLSSHYDSNPLPFFLKSGTHGLQTQGYVGNAKFNFYLTTGSKMTMAMVPDLGNGYYIMDSKRASWNDAATAFVMTQYTTGMGAGYTDQYRAFITFNRGDIFKVRSENWLTLNYETSNGAFAANKMHVSTDGNNNVIVDTAGTYVIYLKIKSSGGYDVFINAEGSSSACTPDSSFQANKYYVVGSSAYYTGTSSTGSENVGFFGGLKMSSGSKISASYNGYYARANSSIFIRSYIDAVDTLYKESANGTTTLYGSDTTAVTLNTTTGVITFGSNAAGYYNISVYNKKITVTPFSSSDFFRLNPIDTSAAKTNSPSAIWAQKTALVLEVPFICNNPYTSKISLSMENVPAYASAFLYCSSTKLDDPYDTLHGKESQSALYNSTNLTTYSAGSRLNDVANMTVSANDGEVYYAYILVDYLPSASYDNPMLASGATQIYFYLTATQQ